MLKPDLDELTIAAIVVAVWTPGIIGGAYWLVTGRSPIVALWSAIASFF